VATVPLNTRSQGGSGDVRRTLAVCEILVADRDDMVTKAMAWAVRALVGHDPAAVEAFLAARDDVLASRVKREVRIKLSTGLKSPGRSS
jgi:3-methyladenine DNA glycosylase AlkD